MKRDIALQHDGTLTEMFSTVKHVYSSIDDDVKTSPELLLRASLWPTAETWPTHKSQDTFSNKQKTLVSTLLLLFILSVVLTRYSWLCQKGSVLNTVFCGFYSYRKI